MSTTNLPQPVVYDVGTEKVSNVIPPEEFQRAEYWYCVTGHADGTGTIARLPYTLSTPLISDREFRSPHAELKYLRNHQKELIHAGAVTAAKSYDPRCLELEAEISSRRKNRKPRGFHGITAAGRRKVRCACLGVQSAWKRMVTFYTMTLPGDPERWAGLYREVTSKAVERFRLLIRREIKRSAVPVLDRDRIADSFIGVVELQESGKPHVHFVMPSKLRRSADYIIPHERWLELWKSAWCSFMPPEISDEDWGHPIRYVNEINDVSSYIAKYMSKGGKNDRPEEYVSAWYFMSKALRDNILRSSVKFVFSTFQSLAEIVEDVFQWDDRVSWWVTRYLSGEDERIYPGPFQSLNFRVIPGEILDFVEDITLFLSHS